MRLLSFERKKSVSSLDGAYALEKVVNIIGYAFATTVSVRSSHDIRVLLCLACVKAYDCVNNDRVKDDVLFLLIYH